MPLLDSPNVLIPWGALDAEESPDILATKIVGGTVSLNIARDPATVDVADETLLEGAWKSVASQHDPGVHNVGIRAVIHMDPGFDGDATIRSVLAADGVESAYYVDRRLTDHGDFHWPLRVAFGESGRTGQAIGSYFHAKLIDNQGPARNRGRYDVLFVAERDLRLLRREKLRAGLVVLLVEEPENLNLAMAGHVVEVIGASAVFITVVPEDLDGFVHELFDQISHNLPVDVACARAARVSGRPDRSWVMTGLPSYVEASKVTSAAARMRTDAEDLLADGRLSASKFSRVMARLGPIAMMEEPNFYSESGGGTEIADLTADARVIMSAGGRVLRGRERASADSAASSSTREVTAAPVRQIQAQVFVRAASGLEQRTKSFEPGAPHTINMRIGRSNLDWIEVDVPFPDANLPANERLHELDIHLVAPGLFNGEQCKTIILGQGAESMVADFEAVVPRELDTVSIAVSVWRGTTHLQSALLEGPVEAGDQEVDGEGIRFATGDRSTVDLDRKSEANISFIQQAGQLYMKRQGNRQLIDLPDVDAAVGKIREILFDGAKIVNDLGLELSDEDALPMLRKLAWQGEFIRRKLFRGDPLDEVKTVDVTSASSGEFLPVEFFYDYGVPDEDATLCSSFARSAGRTCTACEAVADKKRVCPSGFWGVRKIIQRQIHATGIGSGTQPEIMDTCDRLPQTRNIVFAASDEVNTSSGPDRVAKTIKALEDLNAVVYAADTWDAWKTHVEAHSPALLLAIPHNINATSGFEALQIAAGQNLELNRVAREHVWPSGQLPGPLLFLLGCNTANPGVGYQDFVREMRCAGASVVVGTLTYVLGPQAAPLAAAFVTALWSASPGSTVGEILPTVRAQMLRADNPMALALVAYGDADWKIG